MKHIPDLKVIHVRFIKSSSTPDSRPIANNYESSSSRQQCFSEPVMPPQRNRQDPNKAQRTGSPNAKHVIPKSLSISHMMKLGKLAKPNEWVTRWPLLTGQNITGQSFAFQWGQEMFLASCLEPFREFLLIILHKLAGPYPRNTLVYFWALPDISELILCTTNSCLSRMLPFFVFLRTAISGFMPLCFHLVLKRAPRFLSPVRHVDLSQGWARKASWSMAVLGHRQNFSICFNFIYFQLTSL